MIKLFVAIALLACAPSSASGNPISAATDRSAADAALALIPKYLSAASEPQLRTLAALQLAAGDYRAAEGTADRLAELRARTAPYSGSRTVWLRMYARARRYEAEGASRRDSLARAFAELYAAQQDRDAAEILRGFGPSTAGLRQALERAQAACAGAPIANCAAAEDIFVQQMALDQWTYLEGAKPLIAADARRRFSVDDQLLIPSGDGAQIATLVIRPRTPRPLTSLLEFTIYANDDWAFADAFKMAASGYAGAVAYSRGKGRSKGPITPYLHDGKDAAAVIEWLARQPWSDGRVGMFSGSYNAFTQWAAAKHRPPALKALATSASNAPGIDTPMQGNVFQSFIYPWPFYTASNRQLDEATYGDQARWDRMMREWYVSGRPYRDLPLIDGQPNPIFTEWLRHPSYDGWWRALIPAGKEFASIDLPVFVQTGYFDGGMVGALHYFQEHVLHRPAADHRMLIGPYGHTDMQRGVSASVQGYPVDRAAMLDLQDVRLKWFDYVFRGAPLPEILRGRVNFQVMGADRWRHVDKLSEMATERLQLYLSGTADSGRLMLAPRPGKVPPPLRVDFADRHDVDFQAPMGGLDDRNALVFATKPLIQPMEVAGQFRGHLEVRVNKADFDLSVGLFEQGPDGRHLLLASFLGRASHIKDRGRRKLLRPGSRIAIDFESQTVAGRLVPAGSRLVAVVGIPKRPDIQINYGTGRDVSTESIADAKAPLVIRWAGPNFLEVGVRR